MTPEDRVSVLRALIFSLWIVVLILLWGRLHVDTERPVDVHVGVLV